MTHRSRNLEREAAYFFLHPSNNSHISASSSNSHYSSYESALVALCYTMTIIPPTLVHREARGAAQPQIARTPKRQPSWPSPQPEAPSRRPSVIYIADFPQLDNDRSTKSLSLSLSLSPFHPSCVPLVVHQSQCVGEFAHSSTMTSASEYRNEMGGALV
jgi:hypothetical protein